ncbi:hypothetical protein M1247_12420 [Mycobacterium sp. 21AC1]|uniref:hypothetical protein n=1 Tax=[Mycobacterium] appelbergii TaxID=2939269 RepID=UPI002938E678|nr:hypothetical protein [Mycobacterium sp. 21AC1]MDV3125723.1 hypothetical protein [Mycobacterium sp. 21AC1]
MTFDIDRYDYKAVSVLAQDYSAYDLADHIADVMQETLPDGRRIWNLPALDLALLAVQNYPGGATALQLVLDDGQA